MGKSQLIENQIIYENKNVILNQITVKSQSNQIIYEKNVILNQITIKSNQILWYQSFY